MIDVKCYWQNEEIIVFDRGKDKNGNQLYRFYRISNLPKICPWKAIKDPPIEALLSIAVRSESEVIKQYYVTPPDTIESWMGRYICMPTGQYIHFDPISYGDENYNEDVSTRTADFMMKHLDELLPSTNTNIEDILQ